MERKVQRVTHSALADAVSQGSIILWVGSYDDNSVVVRLVNPDGVRSRFVSMDVSQLARKESNVVVRHMEATSESQSLVGATWQRTGWLRSLRLASMHGVNVCSACSPGIESTPAQVMRQCTMGYDIEVSQKFARNGSFPPHNSAITSIALWCTCGYGEAWTTIRHDSVPGLSYCYDSTDLVEKSMMAIYKHCPQWLVGYNSYKFDNCVLAYHCPPHLKNCFRTITSGSKSAAAYSFYMDIPGVNNVDLYTYLDKCLRRKYTALGLGNVATHHGIGGKGQMPSQQDETTVYELVSYNMMDSELTSKLWEVTGAMKQVVGLCVASCSPVVDCVRYVSGTMASCALSSYCISRGMVLDWSECDLDLPYEGGAVLEPMRELFHGVIVVDFSSMYPTIIRDIGISPENVDIIGNCSGIHSDKFLDHGHDYTLVCVKGKIVRYNRLSHCTSREMLDTTGKMRAVYKVTDPDYANGFKVLANSLYGAFGYASSPLYSPRAAATVTLMGRIALTLADLVFTGLGLTVTYGDTDSCMLARGRLTAERFSGNLESHVNTALFIFHRIISYTAIPSMRMEKDKMYKSLLLVDKKHYAYIGDNGKVATKGLSSTRKDRLGVCRDMTSCVAEVILTSATTEWARKLVSHQLDVCMSAILSGELDMQLVSKEVRFEGNTCYRYTSMSGDDINVPVTMADVAGHVGYDVGKVCKALEKDMDRICIPAGIGSVDSMLSNL